MAAPNAKGNGSRAAAFSVGALIVWFTAVWFEILINKRIELFWIIIGISFFQIANWVIRLIFVSRDPFFVNISVSLLHASIISASVVFILVNQYLKHGSINGIFEAINGVAWQWAYPTLCISCGYFGYDQLYMVLYKSSSGFILIHHLIVLTSFTVALYGNLTVNYLILALICEVHSSFMHVRKLRRMAGFRDTKSQIVKLEWVLHWVTFIFARCFPHILITIKLVQDSSKFGKGFEFLLVLFALVGINFLNVALAYYLFNAFLKDV